MLHHALLEGAEAGEANGHEELGRYGAVVVLEQGEILHPSTVGGFPYLLCEGLRSCRERDPRMESQTEHCFNLLHLSFA